VSRDSFAAYLDKRGESRLSSAPLQQAIAAYLDACWALDEPPPATSTGGPAAPTAEDLARTALYRQLDERKSFVSSAAAASSMDAFAASFNLRVDIGLLDEEAAERAAQLTERTNQHNACKCALARLSALALATARGRMSSSILPALGTVSPCAPAMHRAHCTACPGARSRRRSCCAARAGARAPPSTLSDRFPDISLTFPGAFP
jgi:hypothetical protein